MLGTQIAKAMDASGMEFIGTDIDVDITSSDSVSAFVKNKKITHIINAVAYTAVDRAESDEDTAMKVNACGVENLAEAAKELDAVLIHFSTDYVFDGTSEEPYKETDETNPLSAYGRTKLAGEEAVRNSGCKHFIFRISWLYGIHGNNFVKTMLRLMNERDRVGVVNDQTGSPTYAAVLTANILKLINSGNTSYGTYHYSDDGVITWYDFAVKIYEHGRKLGLISRNVDIAPISTDMYPTPAKRPKNSVFFKEKVRNLGFNINQWDDNLAEYFEETQI